MALTALLRSSSLFRRRVGVVSTPISTGNAVQSPRNLCGLPAVKSSTEIVLVDEAEGEKVNRLKTSYLDIIVPMLVEKFSYNNVYEVPKVEKVVVKCDMEDAGRNPKVMETAMLNLELLTGQRPMKTRSRVLDANFKLRDSKPGRTAVTLRGNMMYSFLDRLINLLLPGTMDLRDVKPNSFDGHGNYRFRLHEQSMFPEIRYDTVTKSKGIDVCITTMAKTDKEAQQLLSLMGMPCKIKWMS